MSNLIRAVVLAVLAGAAFVSRASADQYDPTLPPLFNDLKGASSAVEAGKLEDKIWEIWAATGNPLLDRLMIQSSDAMIRSDFHAALQDLDELTRARPDFAEAWNKRATVYYLMGDYQKALADIDRTLALEPRHFGALAGLGLTNLKLGNDAAAVDAFERVIAIDPLYPNAKDNLQMAKNALKRNSI